MTTGMLRAKSADDLAAELTLSNGPFVRITNIWSLLGYPSADAARKAVVRRRMPFPVQPLPGKRGHFVRSSDLAAWLFECMLRNGAANRMDTANPNVHPD